MTEHICGTKEAWCVCGLPPEHDGPHECKCGGSWTFDANGYFVPVALPQELP